jgi:S1-C subfamily serine protease
MAPTRRTNRARRISGRNSSPRRAPTTPPRASSPPAQWPTPPAFDEGPSGSTRSAATTGRLRADARVGGRGRDWPERLTLVLIAALVGGLAGHYFASNSTNGPSTVNIQTSNATPTAATLPNGTTIPELIRHVEPSIVSVDVRTSSEEVEGTGMILTSDGLIVTNNHVIALSSQGGTITVTRTGQSRAIPAVLVGTDPTDDVALIRAEGVSGLPTVTLGNSAQLETGDAVVAIGNALGLSAGTPTVTSGIVSALGRTVTASGEVGNETLHNMIQTDAAINPGNSGGPLLDDAGQVIGMNTAVAGTLSDGENAQNIGFAIPSSEIKTLLPSLGRGGTGIAPPGAFLGVYVETMTASIAQSYGFTTDTGALVEEVLPGTGAAKAGLQIGDIIVDINNSPVVSAAQVGTDITADKVGQRISVTIVRNGARLTVYPTLGVNTSGN